MTQLEFTPIIPKKINVNMYEQSLLKALIAETREHRKLLKKTVSGWTDAPDFHTIYVPEGTTVTAWTHPEGTDEQVQKWEWVNLGTKKHTISARNAPTLRFQTGYIPRTKPRKISSGRSSRFGPWVTPLSVKHPGIEPRLFTETIQQQREKPYERRMVNAMRFAALRTFL